MDGREVLVGDLAGTVKESSATVLDILDVLLSRTGGLLPGIEERLQRLDRVSRSAGKPVGNATRGHRGELGEIVRVLTRRDYLDFSEPIIGELMVNDGHYSIRQYQRIRSEGFGFFGVYANGGVFAFFDRDGLYNELDLVSPESFERIDKLLNVASRSRILKGAIKRYTTHYPEGKYPHIIVTLPYDQDTRMYMDQLDGGFKDMLKILEMEKYFKIGRKGDFRLYIEHRRLIDGRELNKRNGLELGVSRVADLLGLGYSAHGIIYIADDILSESEGIMLEIAMLGVGVTNNKSNVLRLVEGNPAILYVRDGPQAIDVVTNAMALSNPSVAEHVYGQLRLMGYNGREIQSVPWHMVSPHVDIAHGRQLEAR